jgi:hypothetical protein
MRYLGLHSPILRGIRKWLGNFSCSRLNRPPIVSRVEQFFEPLIVPHDINPQCEGFVVLADCTPAEDGFSVASNFLP